MHFTVFDTDGTTPLTGQAGSCTEDLRKNGATTAEVVTLAEIGASGYYYASFTPLATSNYDLEVTCPDGRVIGESYETEVADLDDIKTDSAAILLDTDTLEADLNTYLDAIETNVISEIDDNETKIDAVKVDTAAILLDTDTLEADLNTYLDAIETNVISEIDDNETKIDAVKVDTAAILLDTDTMEADLKTHIDSAETALTVEIDANETKIDAVKVDTAAILLDTDDMEANLTTQINANETKIDVNTGHLTDIKGAGWTNENLKTIDENIDTIDSNVDQSISSTETAIIAEIDANETKIDAIKVDTAAILIDTDDMEANIITEIDANETKIDTMQGNVTDILGDTVAILIDTGTTLPAAITTTEGNIRGGDSDDLKDISDEIAALPTDGSIANQVWDEALADHISSGSFGEIMYKLQLAHINKFLWNDGNNRFDLYNDADVLKGYLHIGTADNVYQRTAKLELI